MTITYSPSTPTRLSNQAASLISPTPSAPLRSSPRFREFRKKQRQARARVAKKELIKLKRAIRFAVNYYKKLENELRNLRDEFGPFSKHHTHFDSTSKEAYNMECPSSYSSFNPKTSRAHRQARRTNLYPRPSKRQRPH